MNTKMRVLEILERNRGKYISGVHIAGVLSVSRNAIWKAVNELQEAGHQIKAAPKRGYILGEESDVISLPGIGLYLKNHDLAAGINIYDVLKSTNNTAKEMAVKGAEHGTIIIADSQSDGRGRFDRSFFSPPGCGLYISFILKADKLWQAEPTIITAYAAVAVSEAVEALIEDAKSRIKWVNDVYLNGRKFCGILSEAVTDFESGQTSWVVVGIGVNCREPAGGYPAEFKEIIGDIGLDKAQKARNELAALIINRMICPDGYPEPAEIFKHYRRRLMCLGEKVLVNAWNERYEATALDIDESGHLLVRKEDGSKVCLSYGEISITM